MSKFVSHRGGTPPPSPPSQPRVGHFYLNIADHRLLCLNATAEQFLREGIPINPPDVETHPLFHLDGTPVDGEDLPLIRAWRSGTAQEASFLFNLPGGAPQMLCYSATLVQDSSGRTFSILLTAVLTPPEPDWEELAGLAHDLRSSLQSIRLLVHALQSSSRQPTNEVLNRLYSASDRAQLIARELLERCRAPIQARRGSHRDWIPLQPLLRSLIGEQEVAASAKGIILQTELAAAAGVEMHTDRVGLGRLIGNLLDNAVRYTRAGHVRLVASWRTSSAGGGQQLVLSVEDSGVGISAEEQESIFQPYQRGRAGLSDPESSGSGVGLATVDRLVRDLGLTLELSSQFGRGSQFELVVPAKLLRTKG